jgi:hypothetical protein
MNRNEQDRIEQLLRQAMPPTGDAEPEHDLWPAMLQRLNVQPAAPPWFDLALAGGLAVLGALFPAAIPVFLYYL